MFIEYTERQLAALGQNDYELAMLSQSGKFLRLPYSTFHELSEEKTMERNEVSNTHKKENFYIRADPDGTHELIFLDDLEEQGVNFLSQNYPPACVIETSKNSFHAWLRLAECVDRSTRKAIERLLIKDLQPFGGADPASACGGHLGRLAGFINNGFPHKPKHFLVTLVQADGHILSNETTELLLERAEEYKEAMIEFKKADEFEELYEITERPYENAGIVDYYTKKVVPKIRKDAEHYHQDLFIVMRLLYAKYSADDVKKLLFEEGPHTVHRKRNPAYYLSRTMETAIAQVNKKRKKA